MPGKPLITQITDLVIQQTIGQRIPTIVFLSDITSSELIKNIISKLCGSKNDIFEDSLSTPWEKVAGIMKELAEIPLLVKENSDIDEMHTDVEYFIEKMNKKQGFVIINSEHVQAKQFTTKENISIMFL